MKHEGLPVIEFKNVAELHDWLLQNHLHSAGVWVRLFRRHSGHASISFKDLLEEGLIFGWSESLRHAYDDVSYLQKFTPRRNRGTTSTRNLQLTARLQKEGRMLPVGLAALGLSGEKQAEPAAVQRKKN